MRMKSCFYPALVGAAFAGLMTYGPAHASLSRNAAGAKNIGEARRGTILAGYLKILPVFIFVLPGMVAAALYTDVRGAADSAYPALVTRLLPAGFKGLVLAGMLAALMSSLASAFNSCSTLLTWDVYRKLKPSATEAELVTFGRGSTIVLTGLGLAWIPMMKYVSPQIYIYLQSVQAYIAPPGMGTSVPIMYRGISAGASPVSIDFSATFANSVARRAMISGFNAPCGSSAKRMLQSRWIFRKPAFA